MDYKEVHERFLEFEKKENLFEMKVEGIRVWELIRFDVYREIVSKKEIMGNAHDEPPSALTDQVGKILLMLKNVFIRNPFLVNSKDILFWGHSRRKKSGDKWQDIYTDPIIDFIDKDYSHVSIEMPYQAEHKTPAKTEQLKYLDTIVYGSIILRKLGIISTDIKGREIDRVKDLESKIEQEFDVDVEIQERVEEQITFYNFRTPIYRRLLKKIDPDTALITVSYGKEAFVNACKLENITVAEIQHGAVGEYHMGYHFPEDRNKIDFPDYFLAFGKYWKDNVDLPLSEDKIICTGYPYFEQEKKKYLGTDEKKQIVFISQGTIGERLSKLAVELSENISDYNVVYKLHPGECSNWKERYPWLEGADLKVIEDDEKQLYELFAESQIQIGVGSTAIYEGIGFGLRTLLVDLPGIETMSSLLNEDCCSKVESAQEILEAIDADNINSISSDRFFEPDSRMKFQNQISLLLDNF